MRNGLESTSQTILVNLKPHSLERTNLSSSLWLWFSCNLNQIKDTSERRDGTKLYSLMNTSKLSYSSQDQSPQVLRRESGDIKISPSLLRNKQGTPRIATTHIYKAQKAPLYPGFPASYVAIPCYIPSLLFQVVQWILILGNFGISSDLWGIIAYLPHLPTWKWHEHTHNHTQRLHIKNSHVKPTEPWIWLTLGNRIWTLQGNGLFLWSETSSTSKEISSM